MPVKRVALPPVEELRRLFHYDPKTGILTNAINRSNNSKAGDVAGNVHKKSGYRQIKFKDSVFKAHRIAWKIYYGYEPSHEIDHINGDRSDNRITNLRDVTSLVNGRNRHVMNSNNTSRKRGVCWDKRKERFLATEPKGKAGISNIFATGTLLDCAAARISVENRLGMNQ